MAIRLSNASPMKKNISLLFFLAIPTVIFLASYRSEENSPKPSELLTANSWTFEKAESLNTNSEAIINALYEKSKYNFTVEQTFQGEFFDFPVQGTWTIEGSDLILNKGTFTEEKMEIAELTNEILKVRVMERGSSVTLTFK